MTDPKLVFIDLDGTLVTKGQRVPDSAREACRRAIGNGHRLFICSGRSMPEIYPWLWDLGFDGIISGAGGYIRVGDEVINDRRITGPVIEEITALWAELGAMWIWQSPEAMNPSSGFMESFVENAGDATDDWEQYARSVAPYLEEGLPTSTTKCTVYIPAGRTTIEDLRSRLPEDMQLITGSIPAGRTLVVEMYPTDVSKGRGIELVAEYLGVPIEDTVAIGDSSNDIEALDTAGLGVAIGGAAEEVLAAADLVAPPIDEEGFAEACRMAGLI